MTGLPSYHFPCDSNNNNNVDTTINSPLTTNAAAINAAITSLSPTSATGTRDGLYQSIALLNNNPNPNPKAVRAVILLTDGDYNWLGDPLGRGTGIILLHQRDIPVITRVTLNPINICITMDWGAILYPKPIL